MTSIYICSPHRLMETNEIIADSLRVVGNTVYLPQDFCKVENNTKNYTLIRHKCIEAIEDSDIFVMYLDDYGMDSAWELGYAEKAGKKIIGLSLDPNKLNTPKAPQPQTIWDHWMHGWKEHTIIHGIDNLVKVLDLSEKFQIPVICPIIEKYEGSQIKILVQTRIKAPDKKYWGIIEVPGGKIHRNETIIETLKREVKEECGLEVEPISPQPKDEYKIYGSTAMLFEPFAITEEVGDHPYIGIFVRCKVVGGQLKATHEGKDHKWVSIDELENLLAKKVVLPINAPGLIKYVKHVKNMRT